MIFRTKLFILAALLLQPTVADVAPSIITIAEGYNLIFKLPLIGPPLIAPNAIHESERTLQYAENESALLLNISLPYTFNFLEINGAKLLSGSNILPRIYAPQVPLNTSSAEIQNLVESNSLDSADYTTFGLSYCSSIARLQNHPSALSFHFKTTALSHPAFPLRTDEGNAWHIDGTKQQILKIIFLHRPVLAAADPPNAYEITRAALINASEEVSDTFTSGTCTSFQTERNNQIEKEHWIRSSSTALLAHFTSGVWSLALFVLAVIGFFIVLCLFCIFAVGGFTMEEFEYKKAQYGKKWGTRNDVEKARGMGLGLEELQSQGRSGVRLSGVGKRE